jgi:hypothetical protein
MNAPTDQESSYMDLAAEAYRIADQYGVREVLDHLLSLSDNPDTPFLPAAIEYLKGYIEAHG